MIELKMMALACILSIFLILPATPAFAYIDAGTGTFVIQMALAFLAGIATTAAIYWRKIRAIISSLKAKFLMTSNTP